MVVFVQVFYLKVFGKENMLIGIFLGLAGGIFLNRDFTGEIVYRTSTFLIINVYLTIAAYLASYNIYLGLFLNFINIFMVTYIYMNDFRNPTSYIFLMIYILMASRKLSLDALPLRILAVITGIIIIIVLQLIFNKNKFKKKSKQSIKIIIKSVIEEIDSIIEGNYVEEESIKINKSIRNLIIYINEKSHKRLKNNEYELKQFNIAICLSRLNVIINHVAHYKIDKNIKNEYLISLKKQLHNIDNFNDGLEKSEDINKEVDNFIKRYEKYKEKFKFIDESIYVLKIFLKSIEDNTEHNSLLSEVYRNINIPMKYNILEVMRENFNVKSLRFRYSIRLATAMAFVIFILGFTNMKHDTWIILSAYVVLQPYEEDSIIKAKKRFFGVTIGVFLFFMVFSVIRDYVPLTVVLFISFVGYFYFKDYSKKVIMTTILSLSSVSLVENLDKISVNRFLFVTIGIAIGLLFNKYILPYNIKDSIKELKGKYKRNTKEILRELDKITYGDYNFGKLIKLSMERNKIENKLILNNSKINENELEKFIYKQNSKMSDEKYFILKYLYENCYEKS